MRQSDEFMRSRWPPFQSDIKICDFFYTLIKFLLKLQYINNQKKSYHLYFVLFMMICQQHAKTVCSTWASRKTGNQKAIGYPDKDPKLIVLKKLSELYIKPAVYPDIFSHVIIRKSMDIFIGKREVSIFKWSTDWVWKFYQQIRAHESMRMISVINFNDWI